MQRSVGDIARIDVRDSDEAWIWNSDTEHESYSFEEVSALAEKDQFFVEVMEIMLAVRTSEKERGCWDVET